MDKKRAELKTLCKQYHAKAFIISDLHADVEIEPWSKKSQVRLEITGPEDVVDALMAEVVDGAVELHGDLSDSIHIMHVSNNCFQEVNIGNNITIGSGISMNSGHSRNTKVKIKAYVPIGADLKLSGIDGETKIGRVGGKLHAKISGSGSLIAELVKGLHLKISGNGTANIREVYGKVSTSIPGHGDITITGGEIADLEAKISGAGDITVGAVAYDADLSLSGMGHIHLRRCLNRPYRHKSGMGSITIDRIG